MRSSQFLNFYHGKRDANCMVYTLHRYVLNRCNRGYCFGLRTNVGTHSDEFVSRHISYKDEMPVSVEQQTMFPKKTPVKTGMKICWMELQTDEV